MPMKFDAARANAIFEKLGDPAFTGPNSEGRIADFVAGELERMGWNVERREVEGSRFPQRAGPWIGWLGYGALITFGLLMMLRNGRRFSCPGLLSLVLAMTCGFNALLCNRIRLGSATKAARDGAAVDRLDSMGDSSPPVRVVFQAVLGGLKTDFFQSFRLNRFWIMSILHVCFWLSDHACELAQFARSAISLAYHGLDRHRLLCVRSGS